MTNTIIVLLSISVIVGCGLLAAFLLGKTKEQKKQSDKIARDFKNEAKKWANSNHESVYKRLRRIAKERDNS